MKKLWLGILVLAIMTAGCGYTTSSALPGGMRTIYIEPFKNSVNFTTDLARKLYIPLLEVKVRNAVVDRFQFDGNLRIADPNKAAMTLKGALVGYDRIALRFTNTNEVEEYRIQISVNLQLIDNENDQIIWEETGFVGEATYFVSGPNARSESAAIEEALVDLGRRIVERTIENW